MIANTSKSARIVSVAMSASAITPYPNLIIGSDKSHCAIVCVDIKHDLLLHLLESRLLSFFVCGYQLGFLRQQVLRQGTSSLYHPDIGF